jgi:hypothetical protein
MPDTVKVVYNFWYGGFGLSEEAVFRYAELKGLTLYPEKGRYGLVTYHLIPKGERAKKGWSLEDQLSVGGIPRHDPALVQVVEELGHAADDKNASLAIREIPKGSRYWIHQYDGNERVMLDTEFEWVQV